MGVALSNSGFGNPLASLNSILALQQLTHFADATIWRDFLKDPPPPETAATSYEARAGYARDLAALMLPRRRNDVDLAFCGLRDVVATVAPDPTLPFADLR